MGDIFIIYWGQQVATQHVKSANHHHHRVKLIVSGTEERRECHGNTRQHKRWSSLLVCNMPNNSTCVDRDILWKIVICFRSEEEREWIQHFYRMRERGQIEWEKDDYVVVCARCFAGGTCYVSIHWPRNIERGSFLYRNVFIEWLDRRRRWILNYFIWPTKMTGFMIINIRSGKV